MSNSLRPAWSNKAGRGFQPPPTVTSERNDKGRSTSWGSQERSGNKFAALDSDDEDAALVAPSSSSNSNNGGEKPAGGNARSEAFKSSFHRQTSTGSRGGGRSLADLAATVPEGAAAGRRGAYEGRGSGRFSGLKSESEAKVIRFTREKLLSMRPPSNAGDPGLPAALQHLEGAVVISETAQDPVCWDTFDAEEIWATVPARRSSTGMGPTKAGTGIPQNDERRRVAAGGGGGRWQRGVALPPPEEGGRRRDKESDNPNDLWDDPVGGATGAAADFSAFGDMPADDGAAFDFDKMADESRKLEEELRGTSSSGVDLSQAKTVDTKRPLAAVGTTIMSGSGDDVNVFEDFDDPANDQAAGSGGDSGAADPSASSRLMQMIGVNKDPDEGEIAKEASLNPWGSTEDSTKSDTAIPLNPWGAPIGGAVSGQNTGGLLGAFASGGQTEADILRQRQEEERQRLLAQQREAEERARHQQAAAMQQQQQAATQQSQVELVLMERICAMLEKTWGRSDLVSILTTLHSEDSRVIPLLNNVDSLRALIARSPQRVALRRDPSFPGEMAVLLVTNAQWQQQQQQRAQQQQQQEMQQRMEMQRRQEQAARPAAIDANAPWFYSDPQGNIQGPFRGEEMRQWLEAGYFKGDLPISQQPRGPFHPLSSLFRDLSMAFQVPDTTRQNDEAEAQARLQAAAQAAAEEDARRREDEERQRVARAQQERAEAEAAAAAAAERARQENGANDSSMQLKGMLGLSGSAPAETTRPIDEPVAEKKTPKKNKKAQPKLVEEDAEPEASQAPAKPAAPAWGGAAKSKPKKTMAEIQQEEARAAAIHAAQNPGRQNSSGWANVAATGKSGWGGEITNTPAVVVTKNAASIAAAGPRPVQSSVASQGIKSAAVKGAPAAAQRSTSTSSSSTPAEEFGTSMSPALEKWCKDQMQKINGSDDLTLVAFCMTLTDASEIRQYLTTYLGSTAQVNSFATEFIAKRGLGPKQQEDWETTNTKKGRKKKAGK